MNEMKIAINQTKQALRSMNFPLLIGGSFIISIMGTLMVLGYHPENLSLGFLPIFWFIMKGFGAISVLMVSCLIMVVFVDTYQLRILKNYHDKRNYLLSIIGIFKNAPTIIKEHTDTNEYKNMLFENMLKSEKPSIWKWFGKIFVQTQKHITNQEEINKKVNEKLKEHDDRIKEQNYRMTEILKKKNIEVEFWKKRTFRLQGKLEKSNKKDITDNSFESEMNDE